MHCVDFPILILLALLRWGVGRSFVRLGASRWLKAFSKGLGIPVDILAYFPLQTGASGGNTFSEHIFGAPSLEKIGLACAAAAWVHWEGLDGGRWARNTRRSCALGAAEAWAWNAPLHAWNAAPACVSVMAERIVSSGMQLERSRNAHPSALKIHVPIDLECLLKGSRPSCGDLYRPTPHPVQQCAAVRLTLD